MTRRLSALAVVLALVLSACSGSHPRPARRAAEAPTVGQCVADDRADLDDVAPDFRTVVGCQEPHAWEVVDVLPVPRRFLRGSTPAQRLRNRADLTKASGVGELQRGFRAYARERCRRAFVSASGLSDVTIDGRSADSTGVYPVLGGAELRFNPAPARDWAAGERDFLCSLRYTAHQDGRSARPARDVTAREGLPGYRTLTTPVFPAARRQCMTYDEDDTRVLVPCTRHHYGELLFRYDMRKTFDTDFLTGLRKRTFENLDYTAKQYEVLNRPCFEALDQLFGEDWDDSLSAVADFGLTGWEADLDRDYSVNCVAVPYESDTHDLPAGSLYGHASSVDLVDIAPKVDS